MGEGPGQGAYGTFEEQKSPAWNSCGTLVTLRGARGGGGVRGVPISVPGEWEPWKGLSGGGRSAIR